MPVTHQTAIFGFNFERHSVGPDRRLTGSALALSHSQTRAAASWVQGALGVEPGFPCKKGRAQQELCWERGEGLEGLVQGSCGAAPVLSVGKVFRLLGGGTCLTCPMTTETDRGVAADKRKGKGWGLPHSPD